MLLLEMEMYYHEGGGIKRHLAPDRALGWLEAEIYQRHGCRLLQFEIWAFSPN
jgi:hypothetical protein